MIREVLTQCLGALKDIDGHLSSVFYAGDSTVTAFSKLDELAIRVLYHEDVRPNMWSDELRLTMKELRLRAGAT